MYMVRNPWGITKYNQNWNWNDPNWTEDYLSQVPHEINPTESWEDGIFFVEDINFLRCFYDFQIAHLRDDEGYSKDWYDVEDDPTPLGMATLFGSTVFFITVPAKSGDLYIEVESYFWGIMNPKCHPLLGLPPYLSMSIM
jgi:hypothetical protein